jgi:hypothetical protein
VHVKFREKTNIFVSCVKKTKKYLVKSFFKHQILYFFSTRHFLSTYDVEMYTSIFFETFLTFSTALKKHLRAKTPRPQASGNLVRWKELRNRRNLGPRKCAPHWAANRKDQRFWSCFLQSLAVAVVNEPGHVVSQWNIVSVHFQICSTGRRR